jgi:hypothetical protein
LEIGKTYNNGEQSSLFVLNFKYNSMKKISLFIISILLTSCGLELTKVDIDLENGFIPEVSVSSYFVPDSLVRLKLVMTHAAYSSKSSGKAILKSASIERTNDHRIFSLHPKIIGTYIELTSSEFIPKEGESYKLHLETDYPSAILESIDTLPVITPILDAEILPVEKSTSHMGRVTFKPNENAIGTRYYELALFSCDKESTQPTNIFYQLPVTTNDQIITREDYYPSLVLIGAIEPQSLLFRVNKPDDIVTIRFMYSNGEMQSAEGVFSSDHDLKIELRSVSYAYFNYKTSLYKQINAANGDLLYGMAAPVTVKGNIKGGLGVFAGYSKSDTTISVAGRAVLKY